MEKTKLLSNAILMSMFMSTSVLWGGTALAADETPEYMLGELVVTASRVEQKAFDTQADVTVITREDLEKKHYTDLGDALKDVPGVTLQNYGVTGENYSSNRLYINGSSNLVVLVDGMRANVNGSTSGALSPSEYANLDTVERIEILKGSASTLYGADAVGGVINIITRKQTENGVRTSISAIGGSYNRQTYRFMNQGNVDGTYWMVAAQKNLAKDFKDADGDKISHKVDSKDYKLTLGHKFGDNADVTLKYSKYKSDYERPASGGLLPQLADRNKGEKDIDKLSLSWQQKLTDELSNNMVIYRNTNNLNDSYNKPTSVWLMDLKTVGFTDQLTYKVDNNTLIAGYDYYKDTVNDYSASGGSNKFSGKSIDNKAFFIQDEFKFAKFFNITPGLRYTKTSQFGSNTSKSVTIGYDNDKTNVYASYKEFFVAPKIAELYSKYGDPSLKAADGNTKEIGIKQQLGNDFTATLSYFKTKASNMIAYNGATGHYANIASENTYGWNFGLNKKFSDKFSSYVNYTHIDIAPETAKKNSNRDGYIPRGEWKIGADYTLDKLNVNMFAKAIVKRPGRMVTQSTVPDSFKSFWLCDLNVNYKATDNIKAFFKVNNLFNKLYTDQCYNMTPLDSSSNWYPAPGRNFQVGVEYTF